MGCGVCGSALKPHSFREGGRGVAPRSEPDSGHATLRDRREACGNVAVMGAGLRAIGKSMDSPPDRTTARASHFFPDSLSFHGYSEFQRRMAAGPYVPSLAQPSSRGSRQELPLKLIAVSGNTTASAAVSEFVSGLRRFPPRNAPKANASRSRASALAAAQKFARRQSQTGRLGRQRRVRAVPT